MDVMGLSSFLASGLSLKKKKNLYSSKRNQNSFLLLDTKKIVGKDSQDQDEYKIKSRMSVLQVCVASHLNIYGSRWQQHTVKR